MKKLHNLHQKYIQVTLDYIGKNHIVMVIISLMEVLLMFVHPEPVASMMARTRKMHAFFINCQSMPALGKF